MPIPIHFNLPKPTNEYEFEDMVEDYFKFNYGDAQKYGRKGQKQYGLDIICPTNQGKQVIGVQCKKYSSLSSQDIDDILDDIKDMPLSMTKLVIATTASTDVKIQNYILEKRKELQMDIQILFWEDISHVIAENDKLLNRYYPSIYNQRPNDMTIEDLIDIFNNNMKKLHILDFIKTDPFENISRELPLNVDIFYFTIKKYLDDSILLQKNEIFISINDFINTLQNYNGYLSSLMSPTSNNEYFSFQKNNPFIDFDKIRKDIKNMKLDLNELYSKINNGCSLFY